ncbi:MAG: hypothetical protein JXB47_12800 [Anaerolineae bacterium]|nr:hypothetical protein [Anaerolineae bacterium]
MEIIEAIEKIGIPGTVVLAVILAGRALWSFFYSTYWPAFCERQRREEERRDQETLRDREQIVWMVEKLAEVSAALQRVVTQMERVERACCGGRTGDTQPLPQATRSEN